MENRNLDVAIVGGGISGSALAYMLSKYSEVKTIGILEKYDGCKVIKNSLLIPDNVWDKLDLKDAGTRIAGSGTWSSYCRECENELLVSVWFF